ncbi:hypothetical protein [Halobacillus faecis]|uniref:Uncharacterized protein n=1 Tax=Halobacillus faecis TaxID=360184 RepID=A0A511WNL6_9BACI|nr:hypothetical protein [Halobacillus faecis]GEN52739.1 hypothetical protein HFA01_10010 [Halobacillus faecis]
MQIASRRIEWKDIIIGLAFIIVLYFTLPHFGVKPYWILLTLMAIVEWVTKFILPWIVLYWAIRLIKSWESK